MTDNQYHALAAIMGTLLTCFLFYTGWDTDGFWLRQAALVFAGYVARTVLNIITYIKD
jgi:hypothetical protein